MTTDLSIVKAIIKRCITDEELKLEKKIPDYSRFSKSSAFKKLKKFMDRHLEHALIHKVTFKRKHRRMEKAIWIYLGIEQAVYERKENRIRYPTKFDIRIKTIDSKFKWTEETKKLHDFCFISIATHCLERVVQRSKTESVSEALELLQPVCGFLYERSAVISSNKAFGRYVIYWKEGYFILKHDQENAVPILLTWLPKAWFSDEQFTKFANFEKDIETLSDPLIFDADKFNDNKVLAEADLIDFKFSDLEVE